MDLGSGIRKKPIPDPGSRGQKGTDPGSKSATLILSKIIFKHPPPPKKKEIYRLGPISIAYKETYDCDSTTDKVSRLPPKLSL
jgi:hypothetical protein